MDCILMHKDIAVAEFILDEVSGAITKINAVANAEHLPVGVSFRSGTADRASLNAWWVNRSIPASRSGVRRVLDTLGIASPQVLVARSAGLSLSDQYWIKPLDSHLKWSEINFFDNDFSEDIGNILLGKKVDSHEISYHSPDITSDGYLVKRWKIINGKRCLLKGGSSPFMQQPFNEVIASRLSEHLHIPHAEYSIVWDGDSPYSVCEDFVTRNTELVSAWAVMQTRKKSNSASVRKHYLTCCERENIPGVQRAVDQMIVLDFLIANEDRHLNNFGLIRDANTLRWIGPAPVFDSGSSLGYNKIARQITAFGSIECKPFKKTHAEQLKLVSSFGWFDLNELNGFEREMSDVLESAEDFIDTQRRQRIIDAFSARAEHLTNLVMSAPEQEDNLAEDVEESRAATYIGTLQM